MELSSVQNEVEGFQPEDFVGNRDDIAAKCVELLKSIYDFSKVQEKKSPRLASTINRTSLSSSKKKRKKNVTQVLSRTEAPLDNLIVEEFDNEQIWEEIQLQNNFMSDNLVTSVSKLLAHQRLTKNEEPEIKNKKSNLNSNEEEENFSLSKDEADGEEGKLDKDAIIFDDDDDDEEENDLNEPGVLKPIPGENDEDEGEEDLEDDDESDDDDSKNKQNLKDEEPSNFEKRRKQIEENIELIEEEALKPKEWKYQGEVTAHKRPENSLLEEHLMFDHLIRQAPEITTETTLRLEDIIKQRIKDQAWDDVERKIKPIEGPTEFKKKLVLDAEKSKMSLSEIYEQEYIKQKRTEEGDQPEEKIPEEELQIQKDMQKLFAKLDALSNFHYTPKPPTAEVKVVTNLPSIAMEEVAPVSVSDATLLAPQEIQSKDKGEIKSKAERSDTDRKRERRQKKKKQRLKSLAQQEKARLKGLVGGHIKLAENVIKQSKLKKDNVNNKKSSSKGSTENNGSYENTKELKSSKAFFAKLQNQVHSQINKNSKDIKRKERLTDSSKLSAKRFKL